MTTWCASPETIGLSPPLEALRLLPAAQGRLPQAGFLARGHRLGTEEAPDLKPNRRESLGLPWATRRVALSPTPERPNRIESRQTLGAGLGTAENV